MKYSIFCKVMRIGLLALPFLSTAAFAQNDQPIVQALDALESSSAQGAQPPPPTAQIRSLSQNANQRVLPRRVALPELTSAQAAALAIPAPATTSAPVLGQPLQIGVARALPDTANAAATASLLAWTRAADSSLRAAISVQAPGAKGLRLGLLIDQLPPGALLRVYAPDVAETTEIPASEVLRTIQANLDAGDNGATAHTYWLPLVESEEAVLEIQLPAGVSPSQLKVSLPTVSHLTMLPNEIKASIGIGAAGRCNVDVTCTSGNDTEMRAVARMSFVRGGYSYYCTGTLLNNAKQDRTPYFVTANHCISTQSAASTLQTDWNFRSASCGGSQTSSSYQRISGGATLLYNTTSTTTDTSFMRLNNNPPSSTLLAGWNASTPGASVGTSVFGIHHPKGDLEKYSSGSIVGFVSCGTANAAGQVPCTKDSPTLGSNGFYNVVWSQGTEEEGSSGSALFTSSGHQFIGQLSNGSADCSNPSGDNRYGRFDLPYNAALYKWLSPTTGSANGSTVTLTKITPSGSASPAVGTAVPVSANGYTTFTIRPPAGAAKVSWSRSGGCGAISDTWLTYPNLVFKVGPVTSNCTFTVAFTMKPTVTLTKITPSGSASPAVGVAVPVSANGYTTFTIRPPAGATIS